MVFIFMALYPEAKPVIKRLGLRKRTDRTRFQEFVSEESGIVLTITGVGPVAAAAAVSAVLTEYDAGPEDQLLSVGTAAGNASDIFLLNKLLDQNSDRTFYPDMLIKTDFKEAAAITGSTVLSQRAAAFMKVAAEGYDLYDMESAAVYQAGNIYLGPHQMSFIRVVSDEGVETADREQAVSDLAARVNAVINSHVEEISDYVEKLLALSEKEKYRGGISDKSSEGLVDKIIEDGHFSKVMQDQLRQYVKYAVLSGVDWEKAVQGIYEEGMLPTIDKRGGKKALDRIKNCILK
ncbi:Nucleoside phosphorylase [Oribacterium sp. KHPX15]|uniref:hypothetical protein n=1 Tax=Oribacterium sp. KHPX15 TaxID=1855342 RepID=UPI000897DC91|nr:hypothetical protein [Oribacterium sp. KHPX15]SEA35723.1 Nucleoside phosphorylase [Oribacterium sp. KHPX15]